LIQYNKLNCLIVKMKYHRALVVLHLFVQMIEIIGYLHRYPVELLK
jgi:hypothetical protein